MQNTFKYNTTFDAIKLQVGGDGGVFWGYDSKHCIWQHPR